jgi:hypothetical protein
MFRFANPYKNSNYGSPMVWFAIIGIWSLILTGCQTTQSGENSITPSAVQTIPVTKSVGATITPTSGGIVSTQGPIEPKLAWFYKPPGDGDLVTIAKNFSFGIMSNGNEIERDKLVNLAMPGPFLQYLRFEAILDPRSCTKVPWKNQVANKPGDYCRLLREHPDWFLRDKNGQLIIDTYGGEDFVLMDPGNTFWRAFWIERAMEAQKAGKWDGIFLDNVEVTFNRREDLNEIPAAYPDEASYQKAVQGFLQAIHTRINSEGKLLYANLVGRRDDSIWVEYMANLDGVMHEGWAIDWPNGYRDVKTWEKHMKLAEDTQAMGKTILLISQGKVEQEDLQKFSYASYLLVMQGHAYFRYANSSFYREAWLYPDYQINLGQPSGSRYKVGDVWRRDFANGKVEVNPKNHQVIIESNSK